MVHSQELTVDSLSDNEENDLLKDKERGLPDWMRDPTEVAAQQEQLATELRSLKVYNPATYIKHHIIGRI